MTGASASALAVERVEAAGRESRVVALVATADKPAELQRARTPPRRSSGCAP